MTAEQIVAPVIVYVLGLVWLWSQIIDLLDGRTAAWFRMTLLIWPIGLALYLVYGIFWLILQYLRYLRKQVHILLKGEAHDRR